MGNMVVRFALKVMVLDILQHFILPLIPNEHKGTKYNNNYEDTSKSVDEVLKIQSQ